MSATKVMKIEKKVLPQYYQALIEGRKNYELRLADFKCETGDVLVLKEWDANEKKYTGRTIEKEVTFVVKTKDCDFWTKDEVEKYGYQVIGLKN